MKRVLYITARRIAICLKDTDPSLRFVVSLRLYHGWHKGFEPTINRKAVKSAVAETDFATLSTIQGISFAESVQYGDRLLAALPRRLHEALDINLPNTLRRLNRVDYEKMVDTALAADLVYSASMDPEDWLVVVCEDDDLVPAVFTAEALLAPYPGKVLLLHARRRSTQFLKLDSLAVRQQ